MKNWIVALAILILPMVAYFVLDKTHGNKAAFEAVAAGKPTVIKFSSTMCLDCKKLKKVTDEVIPTYKNDINFQEIDAQAKNKESQALIRKYNVTLVPTCVFLKKDGTVYKRTEGFIEKDEFESYIKGLING